MRADIVPGATFPDYILADQTGTRWRLSDLQGGDPTALVLARGGYCPKEHLQQVWMAAMHAETAVGYSRFITVSTDSVLASQEWRAISRTTTRRGAPRVQPTAKDQKNMASVLVFDVNETLLDMAALDPEFGRVFGSDGARQQWFFTMKEVWLVSIITDSYVEFSSVARAALRMLAEQQGVMLDLADEEKFVEMMKRLPAHPDVAEGLRLLKEAGFRLFALTNGALSSARAQLEHARLHDFFEGILSADEVKRLKPAREPYAMAAERARVGLEEIRMIAAHSWDIAGAHAAGCRTAFVGRAGKVLNPEGPHPDLIGADLIEVARKILDRDQPD